LIAGACAVAAGAVAGGWLATRDGAPPSEAVDAHSLTIAVRRGSVAADASPVVALGLRVIARAVPQRRPRPAKPRLAPLPADVLFPFGEDRVTAAGRAVLADTAKTVRRPAVRCIRIVGHTDAVGPALYNLGLSRRRAAAVANELRRILRGRAPRMRATGRGEAAPLAPNIHPDGSDHPKGRARNRRVVIVVGC